MAGSVAVLFEESNAPVGSALSPMYFTGISETSPERLPVVRYRFIA